MPRERKSSSGAGGRDTGDDPVVQRLDRLGKLLALLVSEGRTKTEAMLRLSSVGFGPKEIADLLGSTPNAVSVTLHQARTSGGRSKNVQTTPAARTG